MKFLDSDEMSYADFRELIQGVPTKRGSIEARFQDMVAVTTEDGARKWILIHLYEFPPGMRDSLAEGMAQFASKQSWFSDWMYNCLYATTHRRR